MSVRFGKNRRLLLLCVLLPALTLTLSGCRAGGDADPLCGRWAYNHDPGTAVLTLEPSGKAVFQGESCQWERSGTGIKLTSPGGAVTVHRCVEEEDRILFYIPAVYTARDGQSGLVGRWINENNWSYEFTDKGTFLEDGVLPGHYFVDEAAGTITLAYNDPLEDTLLYYAISGGQLFIEYPWPMVRVK